MCDVCAYDSKYFISAHSVNCLVGGLRVISTAGLLPLFMRLSSKALRWLPRKTSDHLPTAAAKTDRTGSQFAIWGPLEESECWPAWKSHFLCGKNLSYEQALYAVLSKVSSSTLTASCSARLLTRPGGYFYFLLSRRPDGEKSPNIPSPTYGLERSVQVPSQALGEESLPASNHYSIRTVWIQEATPRCPH
jgi:hypothetical protein